MPITAFEPGAQRVVPSFPKPGRWLGPVAHALAVTAVSFGSQAVAPANALAKAQPHPSAKAPDVYLVTYEAPEGCPGAVELQAQLGPGYRVQNDYEDPTREQASVRYRIEINKTASSGTSAGPSATEYALMISGLDADTIRHANCRTLLELGVHTLHASATDLSATAEPEPRPSAPALVQDSAPEAVRPAPISEDAPSLGIFGSTVVNPSTGTSFSTLGGAASWGFSRFSLGANGSWIVPSRLLGVTDSEVGVLQVHGFGAGIDACWAAIRNLRVCGLAAFRSVAIEPRSDFRTTPAERLLFGVGTSLVSQTYANLRLEVQPAVLVSAIGAQDVRWTGLERTIYQHPSVELQLRASVAWEFERTN